MIRNSYIRAIHLLLAGIISAAAYAGVLFLLVGQPDTWNSFSGVQCSGSVDAIGCLLGAVIDLIIKTIALGTPLAVAFSASYLKLVGFRLLTALVIALGANILSLVCVGLIVTNVHTVSLILTLLAWPIAYLIVGLPTFRSSSYK